MTKRAGKEYEEIVSKISKFLRQYIKADEFSETERKVIFGVSLGNEK
jgi:hypothetical protein